MVLCWSILAAKTIIHCGTIWRIGNGKDIKVWKDNWLPQPISFKVQTYRGQLAEDTRVAEFIDQDTKGWNGDLIDRTFMEEEAMVIKNIPLSPLLPMDRLIWRGTSNGVFSVRSAYHMKVERQEMLKGGVSNKMAGHEVWKACWRLQIPNAVKMFLWKACHNLLPTKANLLRKKVVDNALCPICLREVETIEHILWDCPSASDVWSGGPITLQKCVSLGLNFFQLFETLLARCETEELELFVVTARRIWLRRNDVIHRGFFTHPTQLLCDARIALEDFKRINEGKEDATEQKRENEIDKWKPPPLNMIKINWDGAINTKTGAVGLGVIARDEKGSYIMACGTHKQMSTTSVMVEAMAALQAMMVGREMGAKNVIFEGDALQIVKAVNDPSMCESPFGLFVEDVKQVLGYFDSCIFQHVGREANSAAHGVAKEACNHVTASVWWHYIPSFIDGIARKEELLSSN